MVHAVSNSTQIIADHPLIVAWLGLFLLLVLLLGPIHVCRILGKCLIVIIREAKREIEDAWIVAKDLWRELTRWKSAP